MNTEYKLTNENKIDPTIIAARFKRFKNLHSTLSKRRARTLPKQPNDLADLDFTTLFKDISPNQLNLLHDNKNQTNRSIILGSQESIKTLAESTTWHVDGTFKCSPIGFIQLYTIHAFIYDSYFPCAYIITQKKSESTYRQIFARLKDIATQLDCVLNPQFAYADFEKATINALEFHFPNIVIFGCWFHFRQAIIRRAFSLGLKSKYHSTQYHKFFSLIGALALLPSDKVVEGYNLIKQNHIPTNENNLQCQLCVKFLQYFDKQWIESILSIKHLKILNCLI